MSTISPRTALTYAMVIMSASDRRMSDAELGRMGSLVRRLPAFEGYDGDRLIEDAKTCAQILDHEDGLHAVLGLISEAIPTSHADLAYAVACEIAVADGRLSEEEVRLLQLLRHGLGLDTLTAAAIERGIVARGRRFPDDR